MFEFLFFFCFLRHAPRSHYRPIGTIYTPKRVFPAKDVLFGLPTISDYIYEFKSPPQKKTSPKWAGISISSPNRQSSKMAIYRSPMKIFASNFTHIQYRRNYRKSAKLHQMVSRKGNVTYF